MRSTINLTDRKSVDELQAHVRTSRLVPRHLTGGGSQAYLVGRADQQGINVQDITKLKAAGIVTILGIAQTPRKNLMKIKVSCPKPKTTTGMMTFCFLAADSDRVSQT